MKLPQLVEKINLINPYFIYFFLGKKTKKESKTLRTSRDFPEKSTRFAGKSRKKQHFSKEASDDNVAMESPTPSSAKEAGCEKVGKHGNTGGFMVYKGILNRLFIYGYMDMGYSYRFCSSSSMNIYALFYFVGSVAMNTLFPYTSRWPSLAKLVQITPIASFFLFLK